MTVRPYVSNRCMLDAKMGINCFPQECPFLAGVSVSNENLKQNVSVHFVFHIKVYKMYKK